MKIGCPFITCAVKQRGLEFCWQCPEHEDCPKWRARRESGKAHDSFVCYASGTSSTERRFMGCQPSGTGRTARLVLPAAGTSTVPISTFWNRP